MILLILLLLLVVSLASGSGVVNLDKPLKGEWKLKPTKVWAITEAGEDTFSRPEIVVAEDGILCVWDWKNKLSYIFNKTGKFKTTFAKRGEGPGEMRWHLNSLFIGDTLITFDVDRLHFFTKDGEFLKSIPSLLSLQEPHFFISENEFITAHASRLTDGKGRITHVNIKTREKRIIKEFAAFKNGKYSRDPDFTLVGISPMVVTAYDQKNRVIYYGVNNSYVIHAIGLDGNMLNTFSLTRKKKKISMEAKIKEVTIIDPSGPAKEIAKRLPDEVVYFHRIQIENGLVLVFVGNFGMHWESQQIDIFSLKGKYLYRSVFKPVDNDGSNIYFSTHCIQICNDHLYVILEDDDGDVAIVKYKIELPKG